MLTRPAELTVHTHFSCQRWQGLCNGARVHDFTARRSAAVIAARDGWAKALNRGVSLREITVTATDDPNRFVTHLKT
jgi:hypothetical protein